MIRVERRVVGDREIVERFIYTMAKVEQGVACRPVDIDIVYLASYGFPAERGGPMFHADQCGLPTVLETMRRFVAGLHGRAWEPSPRLTRLAGRGGRFAELNHA